MDKSDIKSLKKLLYEYAVSVGYEKEKLDKMAVKLNIERVELRRLIREYARKNLNNDEYMKIVELFNLMQLQDREYKKLTLLCRNPILYKLNGKITNQLWENEIEKEIVLKYIFDYCVEFHFALDKLKELANFVGIPVISNVQKYANQYAIEYLGYSDDMWKKFLEEHRTIKINEIYKNRDNSSKKIYESLLEVDTLEEIIKIIEDSELNFKSLVAGVADYIIVHKEGNKEVGEILKSKFKLYNDYILRLNREKKLQEKSALEAIQKSIEIPIALKLIREFVQDESSYNISLFCQKNNIENKEFNNYLLLVQEVEQNLYNLYKAKIEKNQKVRYAIIARNVEQIVKELKNGIEEDGIKRTFDLIDYYKKTNFSFQTFLEFSKSIVSYGDYNLLKRFFAQNNSGSVNNPNVISQIMNEKVIINYQKDKKGMPIPGTEEIFSNEDKQKLIDYLKLNNIPINLKTYGMVFRRYRNGTLELDSSIKYKHK